MTNEPTTTDNPEMVSILADLTAMDAEEDGGSTWMDLDPSVAWGDPESRHGRLAALYLRAGWEECYHREGALFHLNVKIGRGNQYRATEDAVGVYVDNLPEEVRQSAYNRLEAMVGRLSDRDLEDWWEMSLPDAIEEISGRLQAVYACGRSGGYLNSTVLETDPETFIRFGYWAQTERDYFNGAEYGKDLADRAIEEDAEIQLAALASPRMERIEA